MVSFDSVLLTEDQTLRRRRQIIRDKDLVELSSESRSLDKEEYFTLTLLPFVLHLGFMAGVAFLVMHVQVRYKICLLRYSLLCSFM